MSKFPSEKKIMTLSVEEIEKLIQENDKALEVIRLRCIALRAARDLIWNHIAVDSIE